MPAISATREYVERSLNTTLKWAERGELAFTNSARQALFGIVQGGIYEDLRERSALELMQMDFPGYSIGGLAVGEPKEDMFRITAFLNDILPKDKPRYLMGVGTPSDLLNNIANGVDMFDCVMPTRNARKGSIFTRNGKMIIKAATTRTISAPSTPLRLLYLPPFLPRLHPTPHLHERNPRHAPHHHPQPLFLPGTYANGARSYP